MSDVASGSEILSTDRLVQFQSEVDNLRVSGGAANPERTGVRAGAVLMGIGVALAFVGVLIGLGSDSGNDNTDAITLAAAGVAVTLVGVALWLRNSMTRYLRYWLIRLVYEQREQADRIVESNKS